MQKVRELDTNTQNIMMKNAGRNYTIELMKLQTHKHNWDSTKFACLKCNLRFKRFLELLDELDEAKEEGNDTRPITFQLRCLK